MRKAENIFWLGIKELRSFMHDFVLLGFVIYAFSSGGHHAGAEQLAGAA